MKSYELLDTKHPDLSRVVDREGNWENYKHKPSGRYLTGITTVLGRGYPKGPGFENFLSQKTPAERDAILKAAGEKGDRVHRLIDTILSQSKKPYTYELDRSNLVYNRATKAQEQITNDEWDAILSWARFWILHRPIVFASELSVYNLIHGYAGTGDSALKLTRECDVKTCKCNELIGKAGIWDWKTGNGIYPSYFAQVAAIVFADNIAEYLPKKHKIEYGAVLRLGTRHVTTGGYELKVTTDLSEAFVRFLAAKTIADNEYDPFDPESIYEIPDNIIIPINVVDLTAKPKPSAKKRTKKVLSPARTAEVEAPQPETIAKT